MRKLVFIGLLSLGGLQVASGQSRSTYQDDIYFNSSDVEKSRKQNTKNADRQRQYDGYENNNPGNGGNYYTGNDNNDNYYNDDGGNYSSDYIDYDDDDYTYSSYFNRFGSRRFAYRPYFSVFNNPYWYNPYWVDPYWGWNPWYRPGISIGFGGVGPYWNSYWGWQSWYGFGGFNSYWYGPAYSFGWGPGWGYGGGFCGGYYGSYWNGYYAGLYNGGGWGNGWNNVRNNRNVVYGPRYSMYNIANNNTSRISNRSGNRPGGGLRRTENAFYPTMGNRNEVYRNNNNINNGSRMDRNRAIDRMNGAGTDRSVNREYNGQIAPGNRTEDMNGGRVYEQRRSNNYERGRENYNRPQQQYNRTESAPQQSPQRMNRGTNNYQENRSNYQPSNNRPSFSPGNSGGGMRGGSAPSRSNGGGFGGGGMRGGGGRR